MFLVLLESIVFSYLLTQLSKSGKDKLTLRIDQLVRLGGCQPSALVNALVIPSGVHTCREGSSLMSEML